MWRELDKFIKRKESQEKYIDKKEYSWTDVRYQTGVNIAEQSFILVLEKRHFDNGISKVLSYWLTDENGNIIS